MPPALPVLPPHPAWPTPDPGAAGFDGAKLKAACAFASQAETPLWPISAAAEPEAMKWISKGIGDKPEYAEFLGPIKTPRGAANGVVLRGGRLAAEYGDPGHVDMCFSVAKSFLSTLAALALGQGLIRNLQDPVRDYALDEAFETPQNRGITWHQLLNQTSEFSGTVWDKPDQADHFRSVGGGRDNQRKGDLRHVQAPGTYWEYNDVRINRLSLCLLQLFKRNLGDVLKEYVMGPIGASTDWQWHGYRNAQVTVDGQTLQGVPGGGHWGGGLWVHARDLARLGWLFANDGMWGTQRLLPSGWAERLSQPTPQNPDYGYLWWLNPGRKTVPAAPDTIFCARGWGGHQIYVDREHQTVAVVRWMDGAAFPKFIEQVLGALKG